jgi:hypothetical protein
VRRYNLYRKWLNRMIEKKTCQCDKDQVYTQQRVGALRDFCKSIVDQGGEVGDPTEWHAVNA